MNYVYKIHFVGQYTGYKNIPTSTFASLRVKTYDLLSFSYCNLITLQSVFLYLHLSLSQFITHIIVDNLVILMKDLKLKMELSIHMIVAMKMLMNVVQHRLLLYQEQDSLQPHAHDDNARHQPVKIPFDKMRQF